MHCLYTGAASNSYYVASNITISVGKDVHESADVLSRKLSEKSKETQEEPQNRRRSTRNSNWAPPEHKSEILSVEEV
jgi:hypothetical protein